MLYLQTSELTTFSPQVSIPVSPVTQRGLIFTACRLVDGLVGRAAYGMGVRDIINAEVFLNQNMVGVLPSDPVRGFIGTTTNLTMLGGGLNQAVNLSNFSVEAETGIIRGNGGCSSSMGYYGNVNASIYDNTVSPYHSGLPEVIDDNSQPYQITVSFRAGFFTTIGISASAISGSDSVKVSDAGDLMVGQEFSFSSDVTSDPSIDVRYITAIDTNTNVVTFTPAANYTLTTAMTLRQIDNNIKVAVGLIITDLVTFPAGGLTGFMKNLGRSALVKAWTRSAKTSTYGHIMGILSPYIR